MLRQREKFERIDVPRDNNPYRNIIGAGVVVAVCIVVTLVCVTLWNHVQLESHLGDHGLNSALAQQKVSSDEVAGYTRSQDEFTSVLLLTTDKLRGEGCKLQAASLLVLNKSAGTGTLVKLPLNTAVTDTMDAENATTTLEALFEKGGAEACIAPLAAASNIKMTHVIVATQESWDEIAGLSGSGAQALINNSGKLLSTLYTDMKPDELLELAEIVQPIGVSNLNRLEVEASDDEAGTTLDQTSLGQGVGLLVSQ